MIPPAVELDALSVSFGTHPVLDRLDLTIDSGIVALLGPNGAGKTTLINVLATLLRPDRGTARVAGHDVTSDGAAVRGLIGVTGQYAAVDEILTGRENLTMMGRLGGLTTRRAHGRCEELLAQFDLENAADRRVATYSGGMRRRLDLALSLIRAPHVLFLDEPTTGLDAPNRTALWEEVRALADDSTTILLTTQYLEEADVLADRVTVLHGGRIVADDSPDALKSGLGDVIEILDDHGRVQRTLPSDGTAGGAVAALTALDRDTRVSLRRPTMDEVFLRLTSEPTRPTESRPTLEIHA